MNRIIYKLFSVNLAPCKLLEIERRTKFSVEKFVY